jgi:hypothetical protein
MRIHVYLLALLGLLTGCHKKATDSVPDLSVSSRTLEFDPTYSPAQRDVFYVSVDTTNDIRRIVAVDPTTARRIREWEAPVAASPSQSILGDKLVFVAVDGTLKYINFLTNQIVHSYSDDIYESVVYPGRDPVVVACRNDSLFMVDEANSTTSFLGLGYDPVFYLEDHIICVVQVPGACQIVQYVDLESPGAPHISISTNARVHFPSVDRSTAKLAFTLETLEGFSVEGGYSNGGHRRIQTSKKNRALFAGPDLILYTGPDGRLYATDFEGTINYPFIPEGDPEGLAR